MPTCWHFDDAGGIPGAFAKQASFPGDRSGSDGPGIDTPERRVRAFASTPAAKAFWL
jgi:hypothetical protein